MPRERARPVPVGMSVRMFWEVGGGGEQGGEDMGRGGERGERDVPAKAPEVVRPRVRAVRMGVGVGMVATILGALVRLVLSVWK